MKLIQSIVRYCTTYKSREKGIDGEKESILHYFTSVSLHSNIGPIYRTHIGKWKITLQSTH